MISEHRKQYIIEWKKNNQEKCRYYHKKWFQKNGHSYYIKNRDIILNRLKKWLKTEHGKELRRKTDKRRKLKDIQKVYARDCIHEKIRRKKIKKLSCEICHEPQTQAHHDDYSKPFEIRWLCQKHHSELHIKIKKGNILNE